MIVRADGGSDMWDRGKGERRTQNVGMLHPRGGGGGAAGDVFGFAAAALFYLSYLCLSRSCLSCLVLSCLGLLAWLACLVLGFAEILILPTYLVTFLS